MIHPWSQLIFLDKNLLPVTVLICKYLKKNVRILSGQHAQPNDSYLILDSTQVFVPSSINTTSTLSETIVWQGTLNHQYTIFLSIFLDL